MVHVYTMLPISLQCIEAQPCDPMTNCQNLSPGFLCTACPPGYRGPRVQGVGLEYARRHRQVCRDIDECAVDNGGCVPNSVCLNTQVGAGVEQAGGSGCRGGAGWGQWV